MSKKARRAVHARSLSRSPGDKSVIVPAPPCNSPRQASQTLLEPAPALSLVPLHGSPGIPVPPSSPTQDCGARSTMRRIARVPEWGEYDASNMTRFNIILLASVLLVWVVVSVAYLLRTHHAIRRTTWEHARNTTVSQSTRHRCSATDARCAPVRTTVTTGANWKSLSRNGSPGRSRRRRRKMASGPRHTRTTPHAEEGADGAPVSVVMKET
ncbi:hypothetical protein HPB51_000679 [Rhipicephalus microplus]|uniref:Uncharacterized protein n=1 Tax=Rhipicephalus microplus TaxID=6941 RepID=A0A9J6EPR4_RHIMP|nr:hypothetical protein HPB51_000679 [Rhipicephalus microplus]